MVARPLLTLLAALALGGCALAPGALPGVSAPPAARVCHARGHGRFVLPDRGCTPGAVDPRVTQADLRTTICRRGYTRTVRPPESVTYREKRASMAAYGERGPAHAYEYDHLIALELGGAPNDSRNLWPEPGASPNPKDRLERELHRLVCRGRVSLSAAQRQIARNWVAAGRWAHARDRRFRWF